MRLMVSRSRDNVPMAISNTLSMIGRQVNLERGEQTG